jgi:hypothetical protein
MHVSWDTGRVVGAGVSSPGSCGCDYAGCPVLMKGCPVLVRCASICSCVYVYEMVFVAHQPSKLGQALHRNLFHVCVSQSI